MSPVYTQGSAEKFMEWGSSTKVMANVLDCAFEINKFKLQFCYNIHFQINNLEKSMNPLITPDMG